MLTYSLYLLTYLPYHALEVSAVTSAHQAEIAELTDCLSVLLARVADEQRRRQGAEERAEVIK